MSKFQFFQIYRLFYTSKCCIILFVQISRLYFLNVKMLFLFEKEPLSVAGPSVTVKTSSVQVLLNDNVALPCLAQGYPVPEIR
jgi:hypothetical protein